MVSDGVIDAFIQKHIKPDSVVSIGADEKGERVLKRIAVQNETQKGDVKIVPTCARFAALCATYQIPIASLNEEEVDVAVEFAAQVDPHHNFVKQDSWSLVRDKMIAQSAGELFVIIPKLGEVQKITHTIPMEIVPFGHQRTLLELQKMGTASLRTQGPKSFQTETGNYLADVNPHDMFSLDDVEFQTKTIAGVIETGLFVGLADRIIVYDQSQITVKSRIQEKKK